MCGIVGFIGKEQAAPILLDGLSRLEYRGYDSAGLAVYDAEKGLQVVKAKGRLQVLRDLTREGQDVPRTDGSGPHPLGHPRSPQRRKLPPPGEPVRPHGGGTQRYH